jgi:hypothetical protein
LRRHFPGGSGDVNAAADPVAFDQATEATASATREKVRTVPAQRESLTAALTLTVSDHCLDDAHVSRTVLLLTVAVAAVLAVAAPARAADPIGPNQYFEGLVNGQAHQSTIRIVCLGPVRPGQLGRPAPGQSVAVRRASPSGPTAVGFTGSAAREIVAFFGPSASNAPEVRLTEYGVAVAIPTWFLLPCTGVGGVRFFATPLNSTARPHTVAVTFVA